MRFDENNTKNFQIMEFNTMDLLKDVMPFLFLIAVYFIAPHTGGTNSDDCYSDDSDGSDSCDDTD